LRQDKCLNRFFDAGSARLPELQIAPNKNPDQEVSLAENRSGTNGISAGAFNDNFSRPDGNSLSSSRNNSSPVTVAMEAIGAGTAKFQGDNFIQNVISLTNKPDSVTDGSRAISAGEFKDHGKEKFN